MDAKSGSEYKVGDMRFGMAEVLGADGSAQPRDLSRFMPQFPFHCDLRHSTRERLCTHT